MCACVCLCVPVCACVCLPVAAQLKSCVRLVRADAVKIFSVFAAADVLKCGFLSDSQFEAGVNPSTDVHRRLVSGTKLCRALELGALPARWPCVGLPFGCPCTRLRGRQARIPSHPPRGCVQPRALCVPGAVQVRRWCSLMNARHQPVPSQVSFRDFVVGVCVVKGQAIDDGAALFELLRPSEGGAIEPVRAPAVLVLACAGVRVCMRARRRIVGRDACVRAQSPSPSACLQTCALRLMRPPLTLMALCPAAAGHRSHGV